MMTQATEINRLLEEGAQFQTVYCYLLVVILNPVDCVDIVTNENRIRVLSYFISLRQQRIFKTVGEVPKYQHFRV